MKRLKLCGYESFERNVKELMTKAHFSLQSKRHTKLHNPLAKCQILFV